MSVSRIRMPADYLSPTNAARAQLTNARWSAAHAAPRAELAGPILAYDTFSLHDPALLEMMRGMGGRTGVAGIAINERMALRNSTFIARSR